MEKVVLVVMDGIGFSEKVVGNAVKEAKTPLLDKLFSSCPYTLLKAHGQAVGLPSDDDMGNSEVGHNAIGCGQVYSQGAKLVNENIESGQIFSSPTWVELVSNCRINNSTIHFIGLLSDGNVHSNISHLFALLRQSKLEGIRRARIHILLDGRDVPATSALSYVDSLEEELSKLNDKNFDGKIASGGGRMKITMDRYNANWNMVKEGYDIHVKGKGRFFPTAKDAIETFRKEKLGIVDQDLPGFVIAEKGTPVGRIEDNDSVILLNFRGDRAIEISRALAEENFCVFEREDHPKIKFAGMLQYDGDLKIPEKFLVLPPQIKNTLSEFLVNRGIRQYAVSETQKFGHVTYFWNGNRLGKFSERLETFEEIPSDNVSFDERPWMKSAEVADAVISAINSDKFDFIRCNFPNGDMVGHTGSFFSTIIAVEAVDLALSRIIKAVDEKELTLLITADHGNADEMLEPNKKGELQPRTAHSLNKVPFIIYGNKESVIKEGTFGLSNIASTVTQIMGLGKDPTWDEAIIK
ncbi:MAG: 2,3-bisphosphoglycerate-independent phosphoglycerate mutase [Firmicutes bacterium ADurb.Bin080]|jgi:2,3-bisphosphoglycerate-independent phosphoglycerate mutase|nr:2,3-bisphosphoglycerate-independent phosphoglycerate mutase [Clostridiales bacterium]OQC16800.1 MAG: 2,3-bisphosphoglycerate-independent phosphoglycerate mutase [Firmicutes bacterium ADurb.Bin080]